MGKYQVLICDVALLATSLFHRIVEYHAVNCLFPLSNLVKIHLLYVLICQS
jgi:hypothetical protein